MLRVISALVGLFLAIFGPCDAFAAIEFDQNVTPNVIFGTANVNGAFTTDRADGVELALRARTHIPASVDQFGSNGDGTYTQAAGSEGGRPLWGFEWAIHTSWDGTKNLRFLRDLNYKLRIDTDPGVPTNFFTLDPIKDMNPVTGYWDHAIGDQFTGNGGGEISTSQEMYNGLIANKHVAQNSWRMDDLPISFDPGIPGIYTFELLAYSKESTTAPPIAATRIDVIVQGGSGGSAPEPISLLAWGGLMSCALLATRRQAR